MDKRDEMREIVNEMIGCLNIPMNKVIEKALQWLLDHEAELTNKVAKLEEEIRKLK